MGYAGYAGALLDWAAQTLHLAIQIVERPEAHRFVVLPAAGWSNGPWPGSPGIAAAPATKKAYPHTTKPSSAGP